jgi:nitroreductase
MDAIRALRSFRQTREYQDRPVPDELVQQILEIGRWSGSSKNTQPWSFVVLTDRSQIQRLAEIIPFGKFLPSAPLAIVLVMDGQGTGQSLDAGRVAERMMVGAHALGLGSGIATINPGQTDLVHQALDVIGAPQDRSIGVALAFGYAKPRDPNAPPRANAGRRPLHEVVHYGRWGQHQS